MERVKLSECTKAGLIFLYDGETVGLQYILKKIYDKKKLPKIRLCSNQKQLDEAIENSLIALSDDVKNGVEKDSYSLGKLDTVLVDIDITKEMLEYTNDENLEIRIV